MARQKAYFKYDIPTSVVDIVKTICVDYNRRERAIKYGTITGEVLAIYVELNAIIDKALEDIEVGVRKCLITDIQKKRGYYFSDAQYLMAKCTYYSRKRKFIFDIAKSLALL